MGVTASRSGIDGPNTNVCRVQLRPRVFNMFTSVCEGSVEMLLLLLSKVSILWRRKRMRRRISRK